MSVAPFELPSAVRFDNLQAVRVAGEAYLDGPADVQGDGRIRDAVFDLSPLSECNSAAVALLMAWVRYAHAHGRSVAYVDPPVDLVNIIDVAGLSQTLPIRQRASEAS